MTVEQFAEEWSKAEGVTVEDFNTYILPNINKAWNMRFMRITNKVEPFARIKLKSVESINNDSRTSTTIFEDNNQFVEMSSLKTGNIVEFYDENGNSALCVVTRPMRKLTDYIQSSELSRSVSQNQNQSQQQQSNPEIYERAVEQLAEEWSEKEGWSKEYFYKKYYQNWMKLGC